MVDLTNLNEEIEKIAGKNEMMNEIPREDLFPHHTNLTGKSCLRTEMKREQLKKLCKTITRDMVSVTQN